MPHRENIDPEYDEDLEDLSKETVAVVPEVDYNDLQCKYCLRRGMHWEQEKKTGKYYLALPSGRRHTCRERLTGFVKLPKLKKVTSHGKKGL